MATIYKTQSQTFQQITTQQNIKYILNQPNVTFKNKKGEDKQRHGGLTIKFKNDTNNIKNKELTTQINTTEEKSNINLKKYLYNSLTIFEDKKISKLRQKIHNELIPELDKKTIEKNQLLSSQDIIISDISKIKKELLELRNNLIEEKMTININERIKNQKITDNEIRKVSDLEIDIKNKENLKEKLEKNKKIKEKQIAKLKNQNKEKEDKINKIKSKLNEYDNKLSIHFAKPNSWFNKSDLKIKLEKNMASSTSRKEKEKISKKISQLDKEMIKIWNGKNIDKIHEEILAIDNETYFITTFQHVDNSITEQIMFFQELIDGDIQVVNQIKNYKNINEYEKDTSLIEKQNTNINSLSVKEFLNEHEKLKLKPNKTEKRIWWTIVIISLVLIVIVPIFTFVLPTIPAIATATGTFAIIDKIAISAFSASFGTLFKTFTSIFSPATKKVESWFYNKKFKNNELKEKIKKDIDSKIKNLTSSDLNIKVKAEYDILKQELDNRKNKNSNELINNNTINRNSNIESENNKNFDSSIRNTVNQQEQLPSTSTIYHSNSML